MTSLIEVVFLAALFVMVLSALYQTNGCAIIVLDTNLKIYNGIDLRGTHADNCIKAYCADRG